MIEAENRYEHRIVDVCDELHGWATQGDPYGMGLSEVLEFKDWLEMRLQTWGWAEGCARSEYDQLINRLVVVTLVETGVRLDALAAAYRQERAS